MRACSLLTSDRVAVNHCYLDTIKGKQMICGESLSAEKGEELILRSIEANKGCVSRNALIRELAMPLGVCDDIISVGESGRSEA